VKPLYGLIQTDNELPQELLFEINAAWDHLARISVYRDQNCDERREIEKSFSHLKRSCLDVFKLLVKRASEQHHELLRIDTSVIDNGEFDKNLHQFWRQIQLAATSARQVEGIPHDGPVKSFDQWQEVGRMCLQLQNDFFLHERVPWARRRHEDLRLATKLQSWGLQSWGLQSWGTAKLGTRFAATHFCDQRCHERMAAYCVCGAILPRLDTRLLARAFSWPQLVEG